MAAPRQIQQFFLQSRLAGSEAVGGDSPTPDQSVVEENARAIGVSFEDNEELDFLDKIERRDRDRYELEEQSKTRDDTI